MISSSAFLSLGTIEHEKGFGPLKTTIGDQRRFSMNETHARYAFSRERIFFEASISSLHPLDVKDGEEGRDDDEQRCVYEMPPRTDAFSVPEPRCPGRVIPDATI